MLKFASNIFNIWKDLRLKKLEIKDKLNVSITCNNKN